MKMKRVLDPVERASEVVFGLLMALTFTGSVSVAGGGVTLTVRLRGRELRVARRALRGNRRVVARLTAVATDAAGNSAKRRMPLIRLRG